MTKDNAVIRGHLVQQIPKTMDVVALPFEVTNDKFFMLGNFVFLGVSSCLRCTELSLSNWAKYNLVPFSEIFSGCPTFRTSAND